MFRRSAALLAAAALALGPATMAAGVDDPKDATPAQRLSAYVQPSIVYLETTWSARVVDRSDGIFINKGKVFTVKNRCSGFVITPDGYIATAGHCLISKDEKYGIDRRRSLLVEAINTAIQTNEYGPGVSFDAMAAYALKRWSLISPTSSNRIGTPILSVKASWGASVSGLQAEKRLPARVIAKTTSMNGDVGLLKVEAKDLNALPLSKDADGPDTGTEIASIGYPASVDTVVDADYTPSIKTGAISSKKTADSGLTSVYEIDAAVAGGMSGGPTVNLDGEVIGINSFGPADEKQPFNFVRPTKLLLEQTAAAGVAPALGDITKQYQKGLDSYFAGNRTGAIKELRAVIEDQPANGIAIDYLKKAKDLPKPKPKPKESSSTGTAVLVIVLLLVLTAAAIIGAMYFRRHKASQAPVARPAEYERASDTDETAVVAPGVVCASCGTQSTAPSAFCGNCGAKL